MIEVALVVVGMALVQAVSGFGFALVGVPFLALLTDPMTAVIVATVLGGVFSGVVALRQRGDADWRSVRLVTATAIVGIPLGLWVARVVPARVMNGVIGSVVLVFAWLMRREQLRVGPGGTVFAGLASGTLLTSTGMNGPPLVIAVSGLRMAPHRFRATMQAAFVVQDACAVAGFALAGMLTRERLVLIAVCLPSLALGWWLGEHANRHVDERRFGRIVVGLLVLAGVAAIASALTGA